ncbi:hypothetical protein LINGRAHAP2_LOCUS19442 [Linum grandiflorum]
MQQPPAKLVFETSRILALCGAGVVMAVRNVEAGRSVKEMSMKRLSKKSLPLRLMLWNWISAPWHP